MNIRILYATLAGSVVAFVLAWLAYNKLLAETYQSVNFPIEGLYRGDEGTIWWALVLSQLVWAFWVSLVFDRWAGIRTFKAGLIGGAWFSGLMALNLDLGLYSMQTAYSLPGVLIDTLQTVVIGGILGGVIGWILGFGKK